jgi:hypothetical protein
MQAISIHPICPEWGHRIGPSIHISINIERAVRSGQCPVQYCRRGSQAGITVAAIRNVVCTSTNERKGSRDVGQGEREGGYLCTDIEDRRGLEGYERQYCESKESSRRDRRFTSDTIGSCGIGID